MAGIDAELPSHHYASYDNPVDLELSNIMTRASFSHQTLHTLPPSVSQLQAYHAQQHQPDIHPLLKLETQGDVSFELLHHSQSHIMPCNTQLQLSDFDLGSNWAPSVCAYPQLINDGVEHTPDTSGLPLFPYSTYPASLPQPAGQYFVEGNIQCPWSSSPEYVNCAPSASVEHEEDASDDKPYARLIYEALMQAPGHRMMLREIYEWFRHNTTKPQESGSNGWQNSIRHNLSMNKAFENDRDSARGSSRKATSVWILTKDAIDNGVQSTTRYRKTGAGKRPLGGRMPAIQRQRAGARGGRAARNSAKRRHQDLSALTDPASTASPSTTSYSDYGDYPSFDYHELQPAVRSWPMTPVEDNLAADENNLFNSLSPLSKLDLKSQNLAYGEENMHVQNALLQSMRAQHVGDLVRFSC
ncbi:hypothetical protein G647_09037 [Cladophialophora carrionii CBS 160.54]|uniref:Fork-head domain-containing protein n=1 Tax=Cladophialophora carrionii CBS 160.54 TaxID=1279043 RepID=V9D208_9EURO|nr:uncharacterized protein G647_09037 [Cladophialophora carrionii CBS 160.54]ETI20022.1 hypothetical protein G647_09037 [Cladophialophora carrionii CBS 160.54]